MPPNVLDRIFRAVIPDIWRETFKANWVDPNSVCTSGPHTELTWGPRWIPGLRLVSRRFKNIVDPILLERHQVRLRSNPTMRQRKYQERNQEKVCRHIERCLREKPTASIFGLPRNWKTRTCKFWAKSQKCTTGDRCNHKHSL
jgi:hypothetical protein